MTVLSESAPSKGIVWGVRVSSVTSAEAPVLRSCKDSGALDLLPTRPHAMAQRRTIIHSSVALFEEWIMKVGAHVFALALVTLIWTWGLSGCSQRDPVTVTTSETRNQEAAESDQRAPHAEAKTDGHQREVHGQHEHHQDHGPKPDEQQHHGHQHHGHQHHGHGEHRDEPPPEARVKVGDKVPDFSVRTLDGKSVQLSELQKDAKRTASGAVVLSFWCSTCHSCRDMEHLLAKLNKDYEG